MQKSIHRPLTNIKLIVFFTRVLCIIITNFGFVTLFQMRTTKVLSVWAVGFRGGLSYEGPVCKNGNLIHWRMRKVDTKIRAFPIDMAGFAVNLCQIIQRPFAGFESSVPFGHLENAFVLQFISTQHEAECIGSNKEVS